MLLIINSRIESGVLLYASGSLGIVQVYKENKFQITYRNLNLSKTYTKTIHRNNFI